MVAHNSDWSRHKYPENDENSKPALSNKLFACVLVCVCVFIDVSAVLFSKVYHFLFSNFAQNTQTHILAEKRKLISKTILCANTTNDNEKYCDDDVMMIRCCRC